jgi:hypothetical protein
MKIIKQYIHSLNKEIDFVLAENIEENFDIIDAAKPEDLWFNVQGICPSHLIANIGGITMDKKQLKQVIIHGAQLCKQKSRYSYMANLAIIYTRVENLKKTPKMGYVRCRGANMRII